MTPEEWDRMLERSNRDFEQRRAAARDVVRQLREEVPADVLAVLGRGLAISDGPLGHLGQAFCYMADGGEWLPELKMSVALAEVRRDRELMERLEEAEDPP